MSRLFGNFVGGRQGFALLLLRVVVGVAFVLHGFPKMQDPLGWMDRFGPSGMPGILQGLAALSEFGGGIALIIGLLTPVASLGLICTMSVAVFGVHLMMGHPFVAAGAGKPSYELAAVYLCVALLVLLTGPGAFSLDALVFGPGRDEKDEKTTVKKFPTSTGKSRSEVA